MKKSKLIRLLALAALATCLSLGFLVHYHSPATDREPVPIMIGNHMKADNKHLEQDGYDTDASLLCPNWAYAQQQSSAHTSKEATLNSSLLDKQGKFSFHSPMVRGGRFGQRTRLALLPSEAPTEDRILNQLRYVPAGATGAAAPIKDILLWQGLGNHNPGSMHFDGCPVSKCSLTEDRRLSQCADAIMWYNHFSGWHELRRKPRQQIWLFYQIESPSNSYAGRPGLRRFNGRLNWTATYRRESTLVAPYFKFTQFQDGAKPAAAPPSTNYASGKSKKVAWFVSNCHTSNRRLQYALKLGMFIEVDIYGACGSKSCSHSNAQSEADCFRMLGRDYKFYLAFENSNCREYITEKFFRNGLNSNVVPVAMGAHPEDYKKVAPAHSFIHVDDFRSPYELAQYLHVLDADDVLYNEYFAWKGTGLVDTNTYFWCRLCSLLHEAGRRPVSVYRNLDDWWFNDQCLPHGRHHWTRPNKSHI